MEGENDNFKEEKNRITRKKFLERLAKGFAGVLAFNVFPAKMFGEGKEEPTWTLEQLRGFLSNILDLDLATLSKDKENGGSPLAQLELEKVIKSIAPFKGTDEEAKDAIVTAVLNWGDEGEDNVLDRLKEILSERILELEEDSEAEKDDPDVTGKIAVEEIEEPTVGQFNFDGTEISVTQDHIDYYKKGFSGWYEDFVSTDKETRKKTEEYLPERIIYVLERFDKLNKKRKQEALEEMKNLGIKNQHWICTIGHTCPNDDEHRKFLKSAKIPKKNEMDIETKYWEIGPKDGIWFYGCEHKKMDVRTSYQKDTKKRAKEAWKRHLDINRQRQGGSSKRF